MVKIIYWSILPGIAGFLAKRSQQCANLGVGIICGAAQAIGVKLYTQSSLDEALNLKSAAEICKDDLPVEIVPERDKIVEFMTEGGRESISKAKAAMKSAGIDQRCIEIFGIVCAKTQEFGALDIVKEACANLWI